MKKLERDRCVYLAEFPPFLPQDSFVDMCHSVIEHGFVDKTLKYKTWKKEQVKEKPKV